VIIPLALALDFVGGEWSSTFILFMLNEQVTEHAGVLSEHSSADRTAHRVLRRVGGILATIRGLLRFL
jgi:hypothetical protein